MLLHRTLRDDPDHERARTIGSWVKRRFVARLTALATAGSGGTIGASPTPLTP